MALNTEVDRYGKEEIGSCIECSDREAEMCKPLYYKTCKSKLVPWVVAEVSIPFFLDTPVRNTVSVLSYCSCLWLFCMLWLQRRALQKFIHSGAIQMSSPELSSWEQDYSCRSIPLSVRAQMLMAWAVSLLLTDKATRERQEVSSCKNENGVVWRHIFLPGKACFLSSSQGNAWILQALHCLLS